jgi:hypothetical protein
MMTENMLPEEQERMLRYNPGRIGTMAAGISFRRLSGKGRIAVRR